MVSYVLHTNVRIVDRQRKEITPKELLELKRSIQTKGLLHPPVLTYEAETDTYKLLAGERRFRAMVELHVEGHPFFADGKIVEPFMIPFNHIGDLSATDLYEAELEENILRAPLTWLEEAEAKAKIHELRKDKNPKQTAVDTARVVMAAHGQDAENPQVALQAVRAVRQALLINAHKDDPAVQKAKNASSAEKIILDKKEAALRARLAHVSGALTGQHKLIKGDCRDQLPKIPDGSFDIIFSDPPYGINADTAKSDSKHFYDDSPENALDIYHLIIREGFRITKNKATLLLWCDPDHFIALRTYAQQQGWTCWRTPIIFYKGETGFAPWGRAGFVRTYEILLYAVKGQKELYRPGGTDVKLWGSFNTRIKASSRLHAAEKPVELLSYFLSCMGLEGHSVLDPCCGSGGIFPAAERMKMSATGIELSDHYYNVAASRISALADPEQTEHVEDLEELPEIPE